MSQTSALVEIRQLCQLGLDAATIMPALLRALRQLIPSDSAGFFWVDEAGDMTDLFAEKLLSPTLTRRYFEQYYDSPEHRFREKFVERAARKDSVISFTPDPPFEASLYYQEILRPLNAHHMLYAIVRDSTRAFGQLSLYRSKALRPFGEKERTDLTGVVRYMAYALASPPAVSGVDRNEFRNGGPEALVVCNARGTVLQASALAFGLLARSTGQAINRQTIRDEVGRATADLLTQMSMSVASANAISNRSDRFIDNRWGRFHLRAFRLDGTAGGESNIGLVIEQQTHYLVRLTTAMGLFPLSAQQREVALLLAQGHSNAEVASRMGVSTNTANYHVKQLYQKLDVNDRESALARIDAAASRLAG